MLGFVCWRATAFCGRRHAEASELRVEPWRAGGVLDRRRACGCWVRRWRWRRSPAPCWGHSWQCASARCVSNHFAGRHLDRRLALRRSGSLSPPAEDDSREIPGPAPFAVSRPRQFRNGPVRVFRRHRVAQPTSPDAPSAAVMASEPRNRHPATFSARPSPRSGMMPTKTARPRSFSATRPLAARISSVQARGLRRRPVQDKAIIASTSRRCIIARTAAGRGKTRHRPRQPRPCRRFSAEQPSMPHRAKSAQSPRRRCARPAGPGDRSRHIRHRRPDAGSASGPCLPRTVVVDLAGRRVEQISLPRFAGSGHMRCSWVISTSPDRSATSRHGWWMRPAIMAGAGQRRCCGPRPAASAAPLDQQQRLDHLAGIAEDHGAGS